MFRNTPYVIHNIWRLVFNHIQLGYSGCQVGEPLQRCEEIFFLHPCMTYNKTHPQTYCGHGHLGLIKSSGVDSFQTDDSHLLPHWDYVLCFCQTSFSLAADQYSSTAYHSDQAGFFMPEAERSEETAINFRQQNQENWEDAFAL